MYVMRYISVMNDCYNRKTNHKFVFSPVQFFCQFVYQVYHFFFYTTLHVEKVLWTQMQCKMFYVNSFIDIKSYILWHQRAKKIEYMSKKIISWCFFNLIISNHNTRACMFVWMTYQEEIITVRALPRMRKVGGRVCKWSLP